MSFADLGVSRPVADALRKRGVTAPFTIQKLVIADVLAGHDVLVQSPTGSGKTLAFGAPLADLLKPGGRTPAALVLAPTRELATQIADEVGPIARARGLTTTAVYGGVGIEPQIKRARKADIVVATPGRLEDLLRRRSLTLDSIRVLVIDEADRMLDMGFKPAVDRIVAAMPRERQTLFFSATLEAAAGQQARAYTRAPVRHDHRPRSEERGDVSHRFLHLTHDAKLAALIAELRVDARGRTLVFVRTKRGADRLTKRLRSREVAAVAMHGDRSQAQRQRALAQFAKGSVDVLVATDVAARGIDVDDITHVINFDAPGDEDAYVHRVGRTARRGRDGSGVSFVLPEQTAEMRRIAAKLGLAQEFDHGAPSAPRRAGHRPGSRSHVGAVGPRRRRSRGRRRSGPARA